MHFSDNIYSFNVNNGNTIIMCEIFSKLTMTHQNDVNDGCVKTSMHLRNAFIVFVMLNIHYSVFILSNGEKPQLLTQK